MPEVSPPSIGLATIQLQRTKAFVDVYRPLHPLSIGAFGGPVVQSVARTFIELGTGLSNFAMIWQLSYFDGPDAITTSLEEELIRTDKLDMPTFKALLSRLGKIDLCYPVLTRIRFYLDDFRGKLDELESEEYDESLRLVYLNLNNALEVLSEERGRFIPAIERCNFYYATVLSARTADASEATKTLSDLLVKSSRRVEYLSDMIMIISALIAYFTSAAFLTEIPGLGYVNAAILAFIPAGALGVTGYLLRRKLGLNKKEKLGR